MEPLNDVLADRTVKHYVCSSCWGHLIKIPALQRGFWIVECHRCREETKGYVTMAYAERRLSESSAEKMDVQINLRGILPNQHAGKTTTQILTEMGF